MEVCIILSHMRNVASQLKKSPRLALKWQQGPVPINSQINIDNGLLFIHILANLIFEQNKSTESNCFSLPCDFLFFWTLCKLLLEIGPWFLLSLPKPNVQTCIIQKTLLFLLRLGSRKRALVVGLKLQLQESRHIFFHGLLLLNRSVCSSLLFL